jgi:lipoate-protein ligase A
MMIVRSPADSPRYHCELEKQLLTEHPHRNVLLLYINRPSVIVGKNQQIEAEVNIAYCEQHGIEIVRRISGGGAVYHDYGNINYAFIANRQAGYVMDRDFLSPVVAVLQQIGVCATIGARKELLVGGRKISGTASFATSNRVLFHGTLLHNANLLHLVRALQGDASVRGKHVPSVPSSVMNLSEITGRDEKTNDFLDRLILAMEALFETDFILV